MRHVLLLFLCLAAAAVTAAAASGAQTRYPLLTEHRFLSGCVAAGASEARCACMLERFEAQIPYRRFVTVDAKLGRGAPLARPMRRKLLLAAAAC